MKKTLLTALIISASVSVAIAQDQRQVVSSNPTVATAATEASPKSTEVKQAQNWHQTLMTELKLTDEQTKKIAEMDQAFGQRRQAIHNNADLTDEAKAERKAALLKAKEAQFAKLLTAEQLAKYNELMAARPR
jgi:Spy/CpxP family protein refolding chaperone